MKLTIILFTIANLLDFHSTIIQDPSAEENPIIRNIWEQGDIYFAIAAFVIYGIIIAIIRWSKRNVNKNLFPLILITIFILSIFKIIIALTNYGIMPYFITSWLVY